MSDSKFKPSFGIETILSGDLAADSEKFLLFMKAYYEWLQTSKIEFTDKVGTFQRGETIVGATVGATAKIKEIGISNDLTVSIETRVPFNLYETVTGQTSGATATISSVVDNVVRRSGKLLDYRNIETSIDTYVDYLREELYPSIPITYYGNKRLIASKFREFFQSKSNEQSYRFLFKLLYNENVDFYYPGEDVLRVSDGNFEKTQIIRTIAISADTRNIFLFLNKTIRGETSGVLANVVDIKKFFVGALEVAEMTIKLASGTFTAGEDIVDIEDEDLSTTIYGIVSGVTIVDGGSGYEEGDIIIITGDGSEAAAKVSSIKESPISALTVNTIGHGYQLNTEATINNTGTGGTGFLFEVSELANTYTVTSGANTYTVGEVSKISIINRGEGYFKKPTVTLQDTTIASLGLLSEKLITISNAGSNYGVGNTLVFTGGAGVNAAGQIASVTETTTFDLLFEDGFQMKADGSYYDIIKNEDWSVKGPIKRIELTNFGTGYTSSNLPSITISTTTGSSANLVATNIQGKSANVSIDTSNNITGIGSIRAVEITNFGINYSAANVSASAVGDGNANLVSVIAGLGIREGVWLDDDGKIDYKIIQDSYYYQDYSYVIKSGLAFITYSDTLKAIIHPAGLQSFGEIQILNNVDIHAELINNPDIQRMLVEIFTHLNVTGTSATLPTTKFVIGHVDTLPGYGYNTYGNLLMTPFGVYGDDWSFAPISRLQNVRFSDLYEENPAYQTIYTLIDKTPSVVNIGISDTQYKEYVPIISSLGFMNFVTEAFVTASSITPQKFANAENLISLYDIKLKDVQLLDVAGNVFGDDLPQNVYEGTTGSSFTNATFESSYLNYPLSYQEYVKILPVTTTELDNLSANREVVVRIEGGGFRFRTYGEGLLSDYQSDAISTLQDVSFEKLLDTVYDTTIKASPSPFADGQASGSKQPTDTFRDEIVVKTQSELSAYNTLYDDVRISAFQTFTFNDVVPGTTDIIGQQTFGSVYPQAPETSVTYIKYAKIAGTVSSATQNYSLFTIDDYSEISIEDVNEVVFSASAPVVVGTGTNFETDYDVYDIFVANNEYFTVEAIANTTHMVVDRQPINQYSNVFAYKVSN